MPGTSHGFTSTAMIDSTKADASLSMQLQNRKIGFAQHIEAKAAYFRTDTIGRRRGSSP
jgi:hypothetical protein